MKYIILTIIVLLLLCMYYKNNVEHLTNKQEEEEEEKKHKYVEALGELAPAPQVQPGPQGPAGPPGPSGGSYQDRGSLMNLAHTDLRLDRYFGINVNAFLTDPNFRSHQTWTHQTDGQVSNQFGGCLEMDPKTEQVFISKCASENPSSDQMWINDQYGRFVTKTDNNICLEVNNNIKHTAGRGGGLIDGKKGSGRGFPKNTQVLTTGTCNMNTNQVWHFN